MADPARVTSIQTLDTAVWRALVTLGVAGAVVAAVLSPEDLLLGEGMKLAPTLAAIPAALWGFTRGPKATGAALLLAGVLGFSLLPLSWVAVWRVYGEGAPLGEWVGDTLAGVQYVETRKVLGVKVSEEVTEGVGTDFVVTAAATDAILFTAFAVGPLFRRRCATCARPSAGMVVGQLRHARAEPPLTTAAAALRRWIDDPTVGLHALHPLDPDACVMVDMRRCAHCGDARVSGYAFVNGAKVGVLPEIALTEAERASVEARLRAGAGAA